MAKRGRGRPVAGLKKGEMVRDYRVYTTRLPEETIARLKAAADVADMADWRFIRDLLERHIRRQPLATRRRIATLAHQKVADNEQA